MTGTLTTQDTTSAASGYSGAFDSVHHAHGYRWAPEPHHWYWYAGIVGGVIGSISWIVVWWLFQTASAPVCHREDIFTAQSPDESRELILSRVSCVASAPEQKLFLRPLNAQLRWPAAVASFSEAANVRARWVGDSTVVVSQTGGKIWSFQPGWRDVRIRYRH